MLQKLFAGLIKPRLLHDSIAGALPQPQNVQPSSQVTLLVPTPFTPRAAEALKPGTPVKTGQKLALAGEAAYVIATVTGTIVSVTPFEGSFGRVYTGIGIEAQPAETVDGQFSAGAADLSLATLTDHLGCLPGNPMFERLARPIQTVIIAGVDSDLLIQTNQYVCRTRLSAIQSGIKILKAVWGAEDVILALPRDSIQGYSGLDARLTPIEPQYPATLPHLIVQAALGREVPQGKCLEDLGICLFSAEAVASLGEAFDTGQIPVTKTLTFIDPDLRQTLITARIGTPISDIFKARHLTLADKDRIISGGPLRGTALYSENHPVQADTDALMLQRGEAVVGASDYPCINCGECVRICPARMPVNMLVRFLEAGHYQEGADQYDLHACIDCGLCSFVCVSRIPIFQYIRLAKYELSRLAAAEAPNA